MGRLHTVPGPLGAEMGGTEGVNLGAAAGWLLLVVAWVERGSPLVAIRCVFHRL